MSFEDIDTPVSDAELSGSDEIVEDDLPAAEELPVEETADEPEAKAEPAEPVQERAPVIPRARFDEVNAKLHAEREENERLRAEIQARSAAQEPSSAVDIDELEDEAYEATMSGDKERVIALRKQINEVLESRAEARATARVEQNLSVREQTAAMNAIASDAYKAYPFLNHQTDDANPQAINDVVEWRDFYVAKGEQAHVALQKAVNKVGPMYSQEPVQVVEQRQDTRKQSAIVRNLKDSQQQAPAQVAGVGNRAAPPGPKIDSQDDWDKLGKSDRERILMGA